VALVDAAAVVAGPYDAAFVDEMLAVASVNASGDGDAGLLVEAAGVAPQQQLA